MKDKGESSDKLLAENQELRSRIAELERKLAVSGTLLSEFQLQVAISDAVDALVVYDDSLRYIYINPEGASFLGSTPDRIVGKTNREILGPGADAIEPHVRKAFDTEEKVFVLHKLPLPDGLRLFDTVYTPSRDESGSVTRAVGICRDATEHGSQVEKLEKAVRNGTEELRKSRENYRVLVEHANEGILVAQEGLVTFANAKCLAFTGYTEEELFSSRFVDFVHPDDREIVIRHHIKRMQGDVSPFQYDFRIRTKAGDFKWTELNSTLISWEGKQAALCFLQDITERKQAEEALRQAHEDLEIRVEDRTAELRKANSDLQAEITERINVENALRKSEFRYRELVENANSIILRMDCRGYVSFFNEFAQRFFGYEEEEIIGRNVVGTIVPKTDSSGQDLAAMIEDIGRRPHLYTANENENVRSNGERVWVSWTNRAIPDEDGRPKEILCIGNDITELKQAKEALQKAHDELETRVAERTAELASRNEELQREIAQRKIVESALKDSEERYRLHFENVNDVILSYDAERKIRNVSPSSQRFVGYAPEEFLGKTVDEVNIVHPDYASKRIENAGRLLGGNPVDLQVYAFIARDGTIKYGEVSGSPIRKDGKIVGVVSVVRDITKRVETERALQRSENKQQAILEHIEEGYYEVDLSGNFVVCNEAISKILEYSKEELPGTNIRDYMDPAISERVFNAVEGVHKTGEPIDTTGWELITATGARRNVETSVSLIKDMEGVSLGFRGIVRDVTEKYHAAEALRKAHDDLEKRVEQRTRELNSINEELQKQVEERRQAEERYRTLVEVAPVAILIQTDGEIVFVNPEAVRSISGVSTDELVGKNLGDFLEPDARKISAQRTSWMLQEWKAAPPIEMRGTRLDGTPAWAQVRSAPIMYNGRPSVLGIALDITERKIAEEQLRASIKEKEVLLREIHHRVKNNLQVMASLLALQAARSPDKGEVAILREAESRIWSMAVAHETLFRSESLDMIDSGDYFSKLTEVLMGAYGIGTPRVMLTTEIDDIPLRIDSAVNCGLILNELISNCLKHAFDGRSEGSIIVRFRQINQETLELVVRDDGIGMPTDISFENSVSFGSDLVKTLVGDLRGKVEVMSNQGTTVRISFKETDHGKLGGKH